ncbi:electron transfer flavoprotein subunit beta [Oceanimonas sp. NS1]|nr:electron transfer flavoprotein subunit beta [Oceanimonas sp. NS1]
MQPEHLNIAVLVSEGRHPVSGRARRALQDACALEVAFALGGELEVIHAGDPERPALQDYLGMGLQRMTVLRQGQDDDALSVLAPYLDERQPDLLLTGIHAEQGEGSGMLPYLLAEHLGWPLVTGIAAIESIEGTRLPCCRPCHGASAGALLLGCRWWPVWMKPPPAPSARLCPGPAWSHHRAAAGGPASRRRKPWLAVAGRQAQAQAAEVARAKTAADRFKQATAKAQGGKGQIIRDDPQAAARMSIYDLLVEEGVLRK